MPSIEEYRGSAQAVPCPLLGAGRSAAQPELRPQGRRRTLADQRGGVQAAQRLEWIAPMAARALGAELRDWAGTKAADEGADWLRVDVWTPTSASSTTTCARASLRPHRRPDPQPLRALFQRPAERIPMPHLQEVESRTG